MFGREFQVIGAEQCKAHLQKVVLWNSGGTVKVRKLRQQARNVIKRLG